MKRENLTQENDFFGKEKISRILLRIAPPVMLAQQMPLPEPVWCWLWGRGRYL